MTIAIIDGRGSQPIILAAGADVAGSLVLQAEAAAGRAETAADDLSELLAATEGMITNTEGAPVGLFPLDAAGIDFAQNTSALIATAEVDSTLARVGARLRFVGSGACSITIASGTIGGSNADLTFVSNHPLPEVTSTGAKEWDYDDIGDVIVLAGQHVLFTTPVGGVAGYTVETGADRFYFRVGGLPSGTETFVSVEDTKLNAWVTFSAPALQIPRTALVDAALLNELEVLSDVAEPLVDTIGTRTDTTGLFPLTLGATQFNTGNTALIYSATEARTLTEVGLWSANIGDGKINLVIATGTLPDLTFVSSTALTDATLTGPNKWAVNVALAAGQHVLISVPSGGVNQLTTTPVSGKSFMFALGTFTSGSKTMVTSADTQHHAYVKTTAPGVQITRADLAPALADQVPDVPLPTEWDILVYIGQSNRVGSGGGVVATKTVPAGILKQYYSGALTDKTSDPIGNASNNSSIPAQAHRHWQLNGRGVIAVPAASGSTTMLAASDFGSGNWSATGTLRYAAWDLVEAAQAAAASAGLTVNRLIIMQLQGENDALAIDNETITQGDYIAGQLDLIDFFCTQSGNDNLPYLITPIGSQTVVAGGDTAGFQQIRESAYIVEAARPNVRLGFTGAKNFPAMNMMWDGIHFDARGSDIVGFGDGTVSAFC
ncbi:MAG: hypothetical protein ACK4ZW_08630 [Blastomonas sp.]